MRELTVISGKGGTGKTSVVASFAALAGEAVVVDCDVDAPDLHLVLRPSIRRREIFVGGRTAWINPSRCVACGRCQDVCRFDAIRAHDLMRVDHQPIRVVDEIACEGCGVCAAHCPARAVNMVPAENGQWFVSETRFGPMLHARLGVAQENSGKLVSLLRREARRFAEETGRELIICDGPPGIACPVIAALGGSHLALIVTEPTVSGQHDFRRVAELTRYFGVPAVACINKADLNPALAGQLAEDALEYGIDIVGRIPYDRAVVAAQMHFTSLIEHGDGPASRAVRAVWEHVWDRLQRGTPRRSEAVATGSALGQGGGHATRDSV